MTTPTAEEFASDSVPEAADYGPLCSSSADTKPSGSLIRRATIITVVVLAGIAAVVSYRHMHQLAIRHGESPWSAALVPLAVDGMIVAASLALLEDSRAGRRGGLLPWIFLIISSGASLAANVAVAEPSLAGRIIAAWPSLALIGAYEMLMRMIRQYATARADRHPKAVNERVPLNDASGMRGQQLQRQAWHWATTNRQPDGTLPSGLTIAQAFGRSPRWGRLVKATGITGHLD
jgi:hypothetical protein